MKLLKYILFSPIDILLVIFGLIVYKIYKHNPYFSYKSMLRLFYIYGNGVTEIINKFTAENSKPNYLLISNNKNENNNKISNLISEKGYYFFNQFLKNEQLNDIVEITKKYKFKLRPTDQLIKNSNYTIKETFFDPQKPEAVLYEFDTNDLIKHKVIQDVILDTRIYDISKKYFKSEPFFDHVGLSITSDYNKYSNPDSKAAQLYHFDLDRPKWLKFLIYINNVDDSNGPHAFIEGSHKSNRIPFSLRSRGYVRIDDEEIKKINMIKNEKIFYGKAGSAIIEDTIGFHKGNIVKKGYRIMLSIQVNSSMFGIKNTKFNVNELDKNFIKKSKNFGNFFKYKF